jgi:transcriptional regulator with XRE-family HTH domain
MVRQEQGMTQETLAARAGVHSTYVSSVERGHRNLTWSAVRRLSVALGLPFPDLAKLAEALEKEMLEQEDRDL